MKLLNEYFGPPNARQGCISRNSSISVIFDNMHSGEVNIATNTTRATKHLHILDGVLVPPSCIKAVSSQSSMEKYTIWLPGPLPDIYLFWTAAENKFLRPPTNPQEIGQKCLTCF
jgi:hypothetical protein